MVFGGLYDRLIDEHLATHFPSIIHVNQAYCALGPATKVHIEGDPPMSVHWKLEVALAMELFRAFCMLRAIGCILLEASDLYPGL